MYCGVCPCHLYANIVKFINLNTKYPIDEDIMVDYVLHDVASTRDWIGIFPRGWSNFQQYLTFEYAVLAPKIASTPNRSILFAHSFYREASLNTAYQFVYVSKEQQILGISPYFRFVLPPTSHACDNTCRPSQCCTTIGNGYPSINLVNYQGHLRRGSSEANALYAPSSHTCSNTDLQRRTCFHCSSKKFSALNNRADFLAADNDKLVDHVRRLERDLATTETTLKQVRLAKTSLLNRLQGYEAFVTEMLKSLTTKGVVKITDRSGKERVDAQKHESLKIHDDLEVVPTKEDERSNFVNNVKIFLEKRESFENVVPVQLMHHENGSPDSKKQAEDLLTVHPNSFNDTEDVPDYGIDFKSKQSINDIQIEELRETVNDQVVREREIENIPYQAEITTEQDRNSIRENPRIEEINNVSKLTWKYPETDDRDMEILPMKDDDLDNPKQWSVEFESEFVWPTEMNDSKVVPSITTAYNTMIDNKDLSNRRTQPAAILIKGANVKFAIIRY